VAVIDGSLVTWYDLLGRREADGATAEVPSVAARGVDSSEGHGLVTWVDDPDGGSIIAHFYRHGDERVWVRTIDEPVITMAVRRRGVVIAVDIGGGRSRVELLRWRDGHTYHEVATVEGRVTAIAPVDGEALVVAGEHDGAGFVERFDQLGASEFREDVPSPVTTMAYAGDSSFAIASEQPGEAGTSVRLATYDKRSGDSDWSTFISRGLENAPVDLIYDSTGALVVAFDHQRDGDPVTTIARIEPGSETTDWEASYRYSRAGALSLSSDGGVVFSGRYDGPTGQRSFTRYFLTPCEGDREGEHVSVYLLSGQSNMDGHGLVVNAPGWVEPYDDVRLFWQPVGSETAVGPASMWAGRFGPELSAARDLAAALPNERILFVKYAIGGTNLHTQWYPGSEPGDAAGPLYDVWQDNLEAAIAEVEGQGRTPVIRGMFWMQGEADTVFDFPFTYYGNLSRFIRRVREDAGAPDMPFSIGRVFCPPDSGCIIPNVPVIKACQESVAEHTRHTSWFDTDDLPLMDNIHYSAVGQLTLGRRFAASVLNEPETPRFEAYEPSELHELVPDGSDFELLLDLEVPLTAVWTTDTSVPYTVDRRGELGASTFDRVGYLVEAFTPDRGHQWVWVAADPFVEGTAALGVPADAIHDGPLERLTVRSSIEEVPRMTDAEGGSIEFWSSCYGTGVDGIYDAEDVPTAPDCYGSMQIHHDDQVLFAFNRWASVLGSVDFGLGDWGRNHPDWTYSEASTAFTERRIRVYVRPL